MFDNVQGKFGYVVEFENIPPLPITGDGLERPYATALDHAIRTRVIKEGGKYLITFTGDWTMRDYEIYKINEE